jgi:hypothetical protein
MDLLTYILEVRCHLVVIHNPFPLGQMSREQVFGAALQPTTAQLFGPAQQAPMAQLTASEPARHQTPEAAPPPVPVSVGVAAFSDSVTASSDPVIVTTT